MYKCYENSVLCNLLKKKKKKNFEKIKDGVQKKNMPELHSQRVCMTIFFSDINPSSAITLEKVFKRK